MVLIIHKLENFGRMIFTLILHEGLESENRGNSVGVIGLYNTISSIICLLECKRSINSYKNTIDVTSIMHTITAILILDIVLHSAIIRSPILVMGTTLVVEFTRIAITAVPIISRATGSNYCPTIVAR